MVPAVSRNQDNPFPILVIPKEVFLTRQKMETLSHRVFIAANNWGLKSGIVGMDFWSSAQTAARFTANAGISDVYYWQASFSVPLASFLRCDPRKLHWRSQDSLFSQSPAAFYSIM